MKKGVFYAMNENSASKRPAIRFKCKHFLTHNFRCSEQGNSKWRAAFGLLGFVFLAVLLYVVSEEAHQRHTGIAALDAVLQSSAGGSLLIIPILYIFIEISLRPGI